MAVCLICNEEKTDDQLHKGRRAPLCKPCVREAKATGKVIRIKAETADEVRNIPDLIDYAIYRLGCEMGDYKASAIILKYAGYDVKELAQVVDWCHATTKHPDLPWKVIYWVDYYREDKKRLTQNNNWVDPIQKRLDDLYAISDPTVRARIRKVSGKEDKREALALLRELSA